MNTFRILLVSSEVELSAWVPTSVPLGETQRFSDDIVGHCLFNIRAEESSGGCGNSIRILSEPSAQHYAPCQIVTVTSSLLSIAYNASENAS